MDKIREEFKKIELECMHKQREVIFKYIKQNESDKEELRVYLDKINYNIKTLENLNTDIDSDIDSD